MSNITRRSLMQALVGVAAIGAGPSLATKPPYGYLDVAGHRALSRRGVHLRVWYQGKDVTKRSVECSDAGDGWARLYLHDANGRCYFDRDKVADEMVYGITLREGAPFS